MNINKSNNENNGYGHMSQRSHRPNTNLYDRSYSLDKDKDKDWYQART